MPKIFALFFLILICTCGRAQNVEDIPMGSGSVLVDIGTHTRVITVNSANYHKTHRYVSEVIQRDRQARYSAYEALPFAGPSDLRMVHAVIDELVQRGWELTQTNYQFDVENNDDEDWQFGRYTRKVIYYNFRVPIKPVNPEVASSAEVLNVKVEGESRGRVRGSLLANVNGTHTLLLEELAGDRWLDFYRLTEAGPIVKEMVDSITAIRLINDQLQVTIEREKGKYTYEFALNINRDFYFDGVSYEGSDPCGVTEYYANWGADEIATLRGRYRQAPCTTEKRAKKFFDNVRLNRPFLHQFKPGEQRLPLPSIRQTVFF